MADTRPCSPSSCTTRPRNREKFQWRRRTQRRRARHRIPVVKRRHRPALIRQRVEPAYLQQVAPKLPQQRLHRGVLQHHTCDQRPPHRPHRVVIAAPPQAPQRSPRREAPRKPGADAQGPEGLRHRATKRVASPLSPSSFSQPAVVVEQGPPRATPSISSARSAGATPPKANLADKTSPPRAWGENHRNPASNLKPQISTTPTGYQKSRASLKAL